MYEVLLAQKNAHNFDDKANFPHVRTLLLFDTREFLNVIALVCSIINQLLADNPEFFLFLLVGI